MLNRLAPYWKAVAGFVAPGVALFVRDVVADSGLPTQTQWLTIGLACLAGVFGVYFAPKNGTLPKRNQAGAVTLLEVCAVIVAVIALLWLFGVRPH